MSLPRILLLDEDPVLRQALAEVLRSANYAVIEAFAPPCQAEAMPDGISAAPFYAADVIVADEALAGLLPALAIPVLRLGSSAGSVAKPVRPGTLLTRIAQALAKEAKTIRMGAWLLDVDARQLLGEGASGLKVRLTDKETAILECLGRANAVVPREQLLADVWGYSAQIATHTLETHIYRLRRKIEAADPAGTRLLLTEAGGYRLV